MSFIVPALNEELNLPFLFERLLSIQAKLGLPSEILVVDDVSDDRTFEVVRAAAETHSQIRPVRKSLPHGSTRACGRTSTTPGRGSGSS